MVFGESNTLMLNIMTILQISKLIRLDRMISSSLWIPLITPNLAFKALSSQSTKLSNLTQLRYLVFKNCSIHIACWTYSSF